MLISGKNRNEKMFLRDLKNPIFGGVCKRQQTTFYMTNPSGALNYLVNRNLGLFSLKLREKSSDFVLCLMVGKKRVEEGQDYYITSVKSKFKLGPHMPYN